jgi:predicted ATPase with chaperone activity
MPEQPQESLLARLAGRSKGAESAQSWAQVAASQPQHAASGQPPADGDHASGAVREEPADRRMEDLLRRINALTSEPASAVRPPAVPPAAGPSPAPGRGEAESAAPPDGAFFPLEPQSFREAQITESQVEAIALKYLLARGTSTGRDCADQLKLPFKLLDELLRQMKTDQLVVYSGAAPMNDYQYQLTDMGRERARRHVADCTYFGSAPVSLKDYIASVGAQSLTRQRPSLADLRLAFNDLLINKRMFDRLGPAINSGRGLFLYGSAGNGKTSIAERITRAFGESIWIPRAIEIDGEIIRLYDPSNHDETPLPENAGLIDQRRIDKRWIRVRRPTIVAGGELTMANLEVTLNTSTGISEAPLQMKSNCGTLVIDDFGRQRMSTQELLNRWIVPLEKRYDFLNLPNGKKIQVPFDQLIVFSTNLEPRDLVDEAFLRRIPYKIDVKDPTEEEFRELFRLMAPKLGMEHREEAVNYLIDTYYRKAGRPFRCCQPRDLLLQVRNYCLFQNIAPEMTPEFFDYAVENYFAVM